MAINIYIFLVSAPYFLLGKKGTGSSGLPFFLISKCKCGPVHLPDMPVLAIMVVHSTSSYKFTNILLRCPYTVW